MHRTLICLPTLLLLIAGCGLATRRVDVRLTEGIFPPRPPGAEVELWVGETDRPKIPIAVISSSRTAERSAEAREAQVEELRERARSLGAHAVENLRVETAEVNGFVADPRTPFTAFKQGEFDLHFVRGTAVYYLTDEEIAAREALGISAP
ncbi:hypothetical protein JXA47_03385 [Candidatus Sumerlaeota bacterium]|nr:hypothetical protein [Candidatus Sumerlaeota bacterium]